MDTLLPNISDALTVHDAAHAQQNGELHDVALKMLALCDQTHICTDGIDEKHEQTEWDKLPGVMRVDDEVAAVTTADTFTISVSDDLIARAIEKHVKFKVLGDISFGHKPRTPAYELWLIKKQQPEKISPDCGFTAGKHVNVGWPRKHGAYKFPVVAQKVEAGYQFLQVHKDGEIVTIFDKDGKEPLGLAGLVDTFVALDFPETCIAETIWQDGKVQFFDVLMLDGIDCIKLPYKERERLFGEVMERNECLPEGIATPEIIRIPSEEDLPKLESGQWIIRYEDEVVADLARPFWFVFNAREVTPGTVLPWIKPSGKAEDTSGMIRVIDTGLPPVQLHKKGNTISVFVAEGGRNRSFSLPQLSAIAEKLPENFVLECMVTVTDNGIPVSADRLRDHDQDLSGCEVIVYAYDVVYWAGESWVDLPMYERTERLERIVEDWDGVELGIMDNSDRAWAFDPDSVRPMTGDCSHCYTG